MKVVMLVCVLFLFGCQFTAKIDQDSFSVYFKRDIGQEEKYE